MGITEIESAIVQQTHHSVAANKPKHRQTGLALKLAGHGALFRWTDVIAIDFGARACGNEQLRERAARR